MRGWHGGLAIPARTQGAQRDRAYAWLNWWLSGWAGAFVARQGYYMSTPRKHAGVSRPGRVGLLVRRETRGARPAPTRSAPSRRGAARVRDGGAYGDRFRNIAVWNSRMDEDAWLTQRWSEFIAA